MKKVAGIVIGGILVACGIVCILNIFKIVSVDLFFDGWWTVFIILPCLYWLLTGKDKIGSLIGLVVGVLLLLAAQKVFEYNVVWKAIVPLIVVVLGVKLIIKSVTVKKNREDDAVFRDQAVDFSGKSVNHSNLCAIFGSSKCNLTDANIQNGDSVELSCLFGGAEIVLPETVTVKINAICLFGGITDKRQPNNASGEKIILSINGFCIFGGVDIK